MRYVTFGHSGIGHSGAGRFGAGHSGAGHSGAGRSGIKTSRPCLARVNVAETSSFGEKPLEGITKVKMAR